MKNMIRISFAFFGVLVVGIILFWSVGSRRADLVAADQPNAPVPTVAPGDRPLPPVAINQGQILLHTTILDIDREKMAKTGIDFGPSQASPSRVPAKRSPFQYSVVNRREAHLFAKALTASGAAKVLAEPTIVANDARPARFHSGGEFPLIVPQGEGAASVEYRQFGTSVDFLPKKLANGKLRLEIRVDQTDLDRTKSVKVKGADLPGLKTRCIDTTVDLELGKSAMLRAGQLFVIVTPEFVPPLPATTIPAQPARQVSEMTYKAGAGVSMVQSNALIVKFENNIFKLVVKNDGIIVAHPTDSNRVMITAERAGKTKLTVWNEKGELHTLPIHVVGNQLAAPPRPPAAPALITVTALIYSVDSQKLKDAGVNLHETLADTDWEPLDSGKQGEPAKGLVSVIGPRALVSLNRRLSDTKGADVLSRPQIRTISGQEAKIQVGSRVRLPGSGDVQQASGQFQDVGIRVEVVPIVKGDRLQLEVNAEHSQLKGKKVESINLFGAAELYPGETLAICQNDENNEQLLVLLTPVVNSFGATAASPSKLAAPRDLESVHQQRHESEAKLAALKSRFGPNHPELVRQQQQLAAVSQLSQQAGVEQQAQQRKLVSEFDRTIQDAFPDAKIRLQTLPKGILLSGTVSGPQQVAVISAIAQNYFPQVINNLTVSEQPVGTKTSSAESEELRDVLDELFPGANIKIHPLNSSVVLSGSVDAASIAQAVRVAEDYYPSVINQLTEVGGPQNAARSVLADPPQAAAPVRKRFISIEDELLELRQDVKVLRRDVGRLIEILQKEADGKDSNRRPSADAGSSSVPAETDDLLWNVIGIRAEPIEVKGSRFPYRGGLKISELRPGSPATREGMRLGDVLVGLDRWETIDHTNVDFVMDHIQANDVDRLKFYLIRANETFSGHLQLSARPWAPSDADQDSSSTGIPDPTLALKPNDRLTIESLTDKNLNRNVTILADGSITLPLLGQVPAAGLSLERQREELESRYKQYYRNPSLTLSFYGTSVSVEADNPGPVLAAPDNAPNPATELKPGDRLMLEFPTGVLRDRHIMVLADGTVTLPLLGQVPASR